MISQRSGESEGKALVQVGGSHGKASEGATGSARNDDEEGRPQANRSGLPHAPLGSGNPRRVREAGHRQFQLARKRPWSGQLLAGGLALSAGAAELARHVEALA